MAAIETYNVVVVGLGAHGSAALWHLSKTGKKIAGIDRFYPPHQHGSSHGESRIIRQAYHENPLYVPLVKAAYPIWAELGELAGRPLFQKTGGLFLGTTDSTVVSGAKQSAETHGIPYDYLDATQIRKRFPIFRPTPDTIGLLEHEAGILFPEAAITTFLQSAKENGAALRPEEEVTKITPSSEGITLMTSKGEYRTEKLIVSAGAWLNTLFPELRLPLDIRRQVLFWFSDGSADQTQPSAHTSPAPPSGTSHIPIFLWEYAPEQMIYGIPGQSEKSPNQNEKTIKLGWHHGGRPINPDDLTQQVDPQERKAMQAMAATHLSINPVFQKDCVCMYTNTPDGDFIIDLHPRHPDIVIASPCSGHGFKFSAIIGHLLADLALNGRTDFDLTPFAIDRKTLNPGH